MATKKKNGGTVRKVLLFVVGCGVFLAVMRIFNWDPFGVISWIWDWFEKLVTSIADFLTGNQTFRKVAEGPK